MIAEIEKKFLSMILRDGSVISKAIARLDLDVFSTEEGQWLFQLICEHYMKFGVAMTKTALRTALSDNFESRKLEEYTLYAKSVISMEYKDHDFEFYVDRIQNGKFYRDFLSTMESVASTITPANAAEKLDYFEGQLVKFRPSSIRYNPLEHELSQNLHDRIKNFEKTELESKGIPTPIKGLNDLIGGMKKSHLIVFAAPSGGGKTQILANFANHAHQLNYNVVFISLEMAYHDIENRFHSLITGMDVQKVIHRDFTPEERKIFYYRLFRRQIAPSEKVKLKEFFDKDSKNLGLEPTEEEIKLFGKIAKEKALERFIEQTKVFQYRNNRFLIIDSPYGITIPKLRSQIRHISGRFPIDLLVVDYLNLINSGARGLQDWEEGKFVSRSLKQLSREFDFPVLTACQLHLGKPGQKLSQDDIRYSKAISENSDHVIAFRRSEKDELMGILRLELIKHRHTESKVIPVRERFKTAGIENIIEVGEDR